MGPLSPGLALCPEVQDLLEGCDLPEAPSSLPLPEDMALRSLPPLRPAHRHVHFDADRPLLSPVEEVRASGAVAEQRLGPRLSLGPC